MNMNKKKNERRGLEGPAKKLNVENFWNLPKINDKNKNGNSKIEVPKVTVRPKIMRKKRQLQKRKEKEQ